MSVYISGEDCVSCFVVRGCAVSRTYIDVCYCDMCSVLNVYLDHLKVCVVCINGRRFVCCSECNVVSNECEPTSCLVQPTVAHYCEVMCFGLWGELGFLNCDDVCMYVVNMQCQLLEFVFDSVYVDLQYDEISLTFTAGSVCLCCVCSPWSVCEVVVVPYVVGSVVAVTVMQVLLFVLHVCMLRVGDNNAGVGSCVAVSVFSGHLLAHGAASVTSSVAAVGCYGLLWI